MSRKLIFSFLLPRFLKKFELLGGLGGIHEVPAPEYLHHPELLVGNAQYPNMSLRRQDAVYPLYMNFRVLPAAAMPYVHAELEHRKPICHDLLAKKGIVFPVLFGLCGQVKMN